MKIISRRNSWLFELVKVGILFILILVHGCKKETAKPAIETGSVTDIDGNIYKTIKIGKQWWMAENLKVKRYFNGDTIHNMTDNKGNIDSSKWKSLFTGGYFIYDGKDSTSPNYNGKKFGFLYNWYVISNAKNIAPAGWHVPRDDEWKELEMFLGMSKDVADLVNWRGTKEGNKLKIQDGGWTTSSNVYEVWGNNESGFSALGGGCVMYNGIFGNPGPYFTGFWWTASEQGGEAWYRYLDYQKANVFRFYGPKTYGFSIRCVRDEDIVE